MASFIFFASRWLAKTFGSVEIEQIIWNATNNLAGVDFSLIRSFVRHLLKAIGVSLLWWLIVYKLEELVKFILWGVAHPRQLIFLLGQLFVTWRKKYKPTVYAVACLLVSFVVLVIVASKTVVSLKISDFVRHMIPLSGEDFITLNYKVPLSGDISFDRKNDVVLVLTESFESSFFDADISGSPLNSLLMPMTKDAQRNFRMVNAYGGSWTIGAVTGWHFGLPLKLPKFVNGNEYGAGRGFLPGAKSVFDVLRENGYETVLVMGSNSDFSGMKKLFSGHGQFEIYDLNYWVDKGWDLKKYQGTGWGFNDKFVLNRSAEIYDKLKEKGKPFVLFVETIDTHARDGWCPEDQKKTHDVRDAFAWADENLSDFARHVNAKHDDRTVLGIVGDHYFMGHPAYFKPQAERRIFNAFWGAVPEVPELKQRQLFVALDMAPTILQAAGARWSNDQFGLGVSLFSNDEGFAQRLGLENFNSQLAEESALYRKFY